MVLSILFPLEVATGFLDKLAHGAAVGFKDMGGTKLANPIKMVTKPVLVEFKGIMEAMGDSGVAMLILSIGLTFFALIMLVKVLKSIMLSRLENLFDRVIFKSPVRGLVFGLFLTILVQSSSITTSVAIPLVGAGILSIRQIMPYTMGANIGTTVTALLASLAAFAAVGADDPAGLQKATLGLTVAFHHVLFNVVGVALLWHFRWLPIKFAESFARLAAWNRFVPLVYIIIAFYVGPLIIILLGR